jgi:hypothetical protein
MESAIFLFSRVARIPEGSTVLPAIVTEEVITLGAELENGAVIKGQNCISHPNIGAAGGKPGNATGRGVGAWQCKGQCKGCRVEGAGKPPMACSPSALLVIPWVRNSCFHNSCLGWEVVDELGWGARHPHDCVPGTQGRGTLMSAGLCVWRIVVMTSLPKNMTRQASADRCCFLCGLLQVACTPQHQWAQMDPPRRRRQNQRRACL